MSFLEYMIIFSIFTAPAPTISTISFSIYENCEGKDVANYTLLGEGTADAFCSISSIVNIDHQLVQQTSEHQTNINSLATLAQSIFPAGGVFYNVLMEQLATTLKIAVASGWSSIS